MDPTVPETLIRASVQGIVYLIDSPTGRVFTYDPKNIVEGPTGRIYKEKPTYVGLLEKIPDEDKHMISKTNGCLANARVKYRSDIKEVMTYLRNKS